MLSVSSAERLGKRIVGHPEQTIPVVSTFDWFSQYTNDPRQRVRYRLKIPFLLLAHTENPQIVNYILSLFPIITWAPRYSTYLPVCYTLFQLIMST